MRVRLSAHSPDGLGLVLQMEQQRPAKDEVRPSRRASRSAQWCQCLVPQYLDIWPRTHRMDARVGLFPLKSNFSQCAADTAALLGESSFSVCVCVWGGGGPSASDACCMTAPFSCAAPIALQLAARHRSRIGRLPHRAWPEHGCRPLHVACCMFACRTPHDVRLVSRAACCQPVHAL